MNCLPQHGRVTCTRCYRDGAVEFDSTERTEGDWRITFNPLAWGSMEAEVIVLGFSKGPKQAGVLAVTPHDQIAYKGSRLNVGKILSHVGLIPKGTPGELRKTVDHLIADPVGRFHFASLVRCTVQRLDQKTKTWKGSGGGMLDKFVSSRFGDEVAMNCTRQFLSELPGKTQLVVMFGLGTNMNYVSSAKKLFERARGTKFWRLNSVAYTDGKITVVHVEHFASQGALVPNWLGEKKHERARLGEQAREAVISVLRA